MQTCAIEGCERAGYSRIHHPSGLCRYHHHLVRRFGDVNAGEEAQFNALVARRGDDECWLWQGATLPNGYGYFHNKYPHRMAWEFANGPVPEGLRVDHRCHNVTCVNPSHLRAVTQKQNQENRFGAQKNNRAGFRGVTFLGDGRYRARVRHNRKDHYFGIYSTAAEAAEVARQKRIELFTHNVRDQQAATA